MEDSFWGNAIGVDFRELRETSEKLTKLHLAFYDLILELVEINNPEVDRLLGKYEVTVEGKFPRSKEDNDGR